MGRDGRTEGRGGYEAREGEGENEGGRAGDSHNGVG